MTIQEFGNNSFSFLTNTWTLVNSIQTYLVYPNKNEEWFVFDEDGKLERISDNGHNSLALIENSVLVLTSFIQKVMDNPSINIMDKIAVSSRLGRNVEIFYQKFKKGFINPNNVQNLLASIYEVPSKFIPNKVVSLGLSFTANVITNIVNSQQLPNGKNSADEDIPFEEFFNSTHAIGFSEELFNQWVSFLDSITYGGTGFISDSLGNILYTNVEIVSHLRDQFERENNFGTSNDDTLLGAYLVDDVLYGLDGNDTLYGFNGNDSLYGGNGNDTLDGGSGNDLLVGGKGFDTYHIEDHDTVYDADGKGKLIFEGGWLSKDVEFSQAFEDTLNETWAYKVKGKTTHRAYKDGKDLIIIDLNNDHQVTVKDFFEVAVYQNNAYSALNIQLPSKPLNPDDEKYNIISANPDYVANIYASGSKQLKIFGSNKDDNIFANNRDLASIIKAGAGHDSVFGSNSKDEIFGGAGNDALYGSSGFLDFATANVPEEDHDIIIGNEGYDLISAGVGDDVIYVDEKRSHLIQDSSNRHGDWALGGKGDDTIHGGVGRDFLQGGAGADVIFAGSGDDVLLGDGHIRFGVKSNTRYNLDTINSGYTNVGSGIHSLVGGVLSPTVSVTKGDTLSIEYRITNKDGKEILSAEEQQSAYTRDNKTFDWDIETIKDGLDYFINTHQEVPLTFNHHALESNNAHDILYGGLGNDLIIGQYGNDTLFGGEGNDILFGDDNRDLTITGNDTLNGGKGNDKLYGGRGSDYLIASEGQDILDGGDDYDFYIFDYPALQDGLDKTIVDKQGQGQLSIAGTDWASKTWLNIDLNDKNHPDPYLAQDSALRSRLQDAPTWTDGTGSFIQVVGGELHIISRYFSSKIMIQSDEIQLGDGQTESRLPFNFKLESAKKNTAPEVANQYSDQVVIADKVFNFVLPNDLFNDADGDELNYQVSLANGQALPTWLQFDANSKTLSGTAPSQSQVALKITATDNYGETAEQTFNLRTNSAPELAEAFSPQYIVQPQRARQQVWTYQTAKHFKDIDQDQLQYSVHIKSAPSGITSQAVSINSSTGVLSLNQSFLQAGKYQLDITATDPHGQSYTATADINLVAPVSNPIAQISPQADIFNHIGFQQPSLFNPVRQAKGGETHGYFFNDNIQGIANQAHQISGKAGNDKLYGANLNDVLSGDAGHDTLYGLQGNDTLSGGLGNDILVGGQGNDVLIGGDGNDMYFYQRGDGLDYLIDTQGVDTLDFSQGRISLNDVLLKLDESNHKNAIVSFKHHQQSNNKNEQLYIENWANAIEYIKTTEGIFDFKQLMQTVI